MPLLLWSPESRLRVLYRAEAAANFDCGGAAEDAREVGADAAQVVPEILSPNGRCDARSERRRRRQQQQRACTK